MAAAAEVPPTENAPVATNNENGSQEVVPRTIREIPEEARQYISPEVQKVLDGWRNEPKKTADELVAELMKDVSDEGIKEGFAKMDKLHQDLTQKVESMHTTFTEKIADIQADIQKFHEIDKEYKAAHEKMQTILNQKPPEGVITSEEIKQMMEDFKAGKFKDGCARIEGKLEFRFGKAENGNALAAAAAALGNGEPDPKLVGLTNGSHAATNGSPDTSTEDAAFDDAASTTSESSVVSESNPDTKKTKTPKSPKTSTGKPKGKADEGKKAATKKKSGAKN